MKSQFAEQVRLLCMTNTLALKVGDIDSDSPCLSNSIILFMASNKSRYSFNSLCSYRTLFPVGCSFLMHVEVMCKTNNFVARVLRYNELWKQ